MSQAFAGAQKLGRALMLPIAVLPVAGLLLRLGQKDLLDLHVMADAGEVVFKNLALLFAIGVAVGFASDGHGVAGLAGAIGYLVMTAAIRAIDPKVDMGVLAGIITGLTAGALYNRTKDIKLPSYLAFFGGRRFTAIATGFACVLLGVAFGYGWPPVQRGIDGLGHWLLATGAVGLFVYGALNRLLLVTGLHHILNALVWFGFGTYATAEGVVRGDLNRFFAGDPTAGSFMAGFFPIMMFGLPAAAIAMMRAARPDRKKTAGSVLLSTGLTSGLTGVTEPIEFSFMFHAPVLYLFHAILTGASMALMYLLGVRLGFTFSAGAFDYALSASQGDGAWLLFPIGAATFVVYYALFAFAIRRFDLATPGREAEAAPTTAAPTDRAAAFVAALGGADNLVTVDACATRLRLAVRASDRIDDAALRALGAHGVVRPAPGSVQVVLGPIADQVADTIRVALRAPAAAVVDLAAWSAAISNAAAVEHIAATRLRVTLAADTTIDRAALTRLGAHVMDISPTTLHIIVGPSAASIAASLNR
ncbi:MAG TPA: PTS transporter subunit EIIC [Kofleriaceae bacterium]|nr:PTS transporter subunit EIIC [Kofleriaceae bacterium]